MATKPKRLDDWASAAHASCENSAATHDRLHTPAKLHSSYRTTGRSVPMITPTQPEDPTTKLTIWWVGNSNSPWHDEFVRWIIGPDSPRPTEAKWEILYSEDGSPSLPRATGQPIHSPKCKLGIVVWTVPSHGIAELLKHIAATRRTRPGYAHVTAGLASPAERLLISEFGVVAHIQHPKDWASWSALFADQKKTARSISVNRNQSTVTG
ncbi:hypothetical protein [Aporhodopirellula aestuarii]|uniref:Uncharacterized protein n=1 Tax=Aporhodopirellula aestuarii TaxID=2950107 RepID=A0ABT0TXR2_9BACT|nr:hypothetical protein [Aporhodopirellula aestuarii]MCM2369389.1 hypothetical protein [Aporhodopirellula aestuarii]